MAEISSSSIRSNNFLFLLDIEYYQELQVDFLRLAQSFLFLVQRDIVSIFEIESSRQRESISDLQKFEFHLENRVQKLIMSFDSFLDRN